MTTIFAPSTGAPPAAIAIVRISGPDAFAAARALAGPLAPPREARVRTLRDPASGDHLDRGLVLVFPGPATATGEDLVELHIHGGRAVVAAIETALAKLPGLRRAEPGEFTRRALTNGRIDLAEAEGLGDLLSAETELQRRAAMVMADGVLSRQIGGWRNALIGLAARIEASLDFADEADVPQALLDDVRDRAGAIAGEMRSVLAAPSVERLRDGIRVVLAGPPNSGKSTLLNALARREAAIVSPIAGTTRDRIEVTVARDGIPFVLTDTAGLRDSPEDAIERIGIARADQAIAEADLVLWLGDRPPPAEGILRLHARCDLPERCEPAPGAIAVSAEWPESVEALWNVITNRARALIPKPGDLALNRRQASHCADALAALDDAAAADELIVADALRRANVALARITGDIGIEAMLDALFGKFCIGK
ncbi:tRNA uridine-5-carboxymethylaminomethyl(34) synthesis GTPase MnmE [Sphingomonas sp.]|jgi:tRNA modification GTPase|uniref:tRNA uridine-5-carboxymethylaminomethyl(34) synthesis GTPase MnmE n=1 Tax=Sphingomonas sp. TaxID=28214 RepID=UPI002E325B3F|nr:tRNA uridine-5-carboxymethylaminomethyl(34) synthesis GTPase MnmE [Sphingomonas sp.]HEX4695361.1 tRNA uridine-5-carboxymethylaminomethyl(34) synthesis GTPase MnmE [Sphingomonas sp.]